MSERKFYQKITDIYATSIDYDKTAKATIRFFFICPKQITLCCFWKHCLQKLYIIEQIAKKENMGLTTWKGAPDSKIHKYDVVIAKIIYQKKKLDN